VTWAGGVFGHAPTPTACLPCHNSTQQPTGAVGSASFNHATSAAGQDCASCHTTNVGVSWSGGLFSHAGLTTCASCHSSDMPSGTVPNTSDGFNHASAYGTECAPCHTVVPGNVGTSWAEGYFGHNGNDPSSLNNCSPCHDTKHHNAGQNCTNCHNVTWPSPNSSGNYGGSFNNG
jgi:hypothetical protein